MASNRPTAKQLALRLVQGETLSRKDIGGSDMAKLIVQELQLIKTNCSYVIKQLKEW